jgi:O-antigen/teichoic acid export membrane protein
MLIGSALVSLVNFAYNVAVARLLGPADFGHAAAMVTILMLLSALTLAFQLVCAKFVARNESPAAKAAVFQHLRRRAWAAGIAIGSILVVFSTVIAKYLRLPSASLVVILAIGVAFYIPLGVKRGGMQGICAFLRLSGNFILEVVAKFVTAIVAILLGYGVSGAVAAISVSVIIAYFLPPNGPELEGTPVPAIPASFTEGMQAIVFFVGQVIINNVDILLVKHFFEVRIAGLYAAVALVGRVVYMLSWSVVSAMFPISAGAKRDPDGTSVLVMPLVLVLSITMLFTFGLGLSPDFVLRVVFGSAFNHIPGKENLLMLYAAATGTYSLAVVLMAYEISRKIANSGWIQLAFSGAVIVGISLFHNTLREVILVQLAVMVALLITVSLPFFRTRARGGSLSAEPAFAGPVSDLNLNGGPSFRLLKRVSEADVVAEFLKSEFYHPEYEHDRTRWMHLVFEADTTNHVENGIRKALLFRRRATMWREFPEDTQWWEIELPVEELPRIRVFPRAQWRKIASDSYELSHVAEQLRAGQYSNRVSAYVQKVFSLRDYLRRQDHCSSILLIGIDQAHPLTIVEGNHRMTAAMLVSPDVARRQFRFICGFSPRMNECCWYQTNLSTLWHYARNRARLLMYDTEEEIGKLVSQATGSGDACFTSTKADAVPDSK